MKLKCPTCSALLSVPETTLGKLIACPKCANKFVANTSHAVPDDAVPEKKPSARIVPGSGEYQLSSHAAGGPPSQPEYFKWKNCPSCGAVWTSGSEVCFKCHFNARLNRIIKPVKNSRFALKIDFQKAYLWIALAVAGVGVYFLVTNWLRINAWVNTLWK